MPVTNSPTRGLGLIAGANRRCLAQTVEEPSMHQTASPPSKSADVINFEDESIRALLFQIAKSLVPADSTVSVNILYEFDSPTAIVMIAPEHLGRVVGDRGRIARSIRTILTAAAMTFARRYALDIRAIK